MNRKSIVVTIVMVIVVIVSSICTGCGHRPLYSHYEQVDILGWNKDRLLVFPVLVSDTTQRYDITLRVRSTDVFPYENFWLFVSTDTIRDTIEVFLSDERGRRLGHEHNGYNDVAVSVAAGVLFHSDTTLITVQQAMRDENIVGISAIGIEVDGVEK